MNIGQTHYDYIGTELSLERASELKEFNNRYVKKQEDVQETNDIKQSDKQQYIINNSNIQEMNLNKSYDLTEPQKHVKLIQIMGYHVASHIPTHDVVKIMGK